jgi:hypothetical protein
MTSREWRSIGFWLPRQPIAGEVGSMPWSYRPFASYVVLPQGATGPFTEVEPIGAGNVSIGQTP